MFFHGLSCDARKCPAVKCCFPVWVVQFVEVGLTFGLWLLSDLWRPVSREVRICGLQNRVKYLAENGWDRAFCSILHPWESRHWTFPRETKTSNGPAFQSHSQFFFFFSFIISLFQSEKKSSLDSDWKCKTCLGLVFNRKIIFMSSIQWSVPDLMGELCEKLCDDRVTPSIICTFATTIAAKSRSNTFSPCKVGLHQIPFIIPFTMHKYLTI